MKPNMTSTRHAGARHPFYTHTDILRPYFCFRWLGMYISNLRMQGLHTKQPSHVEINFNMACVRARTCHARVTTLPHTGTSQLIYTLTRTLHRLYKQGLKSDTAQNAQQTRNKIFKIVDPKWRPLDAHVGGTRFIRTQRLYDLCFVFNG